MRSKLTDYMKINYGNHILIVCSTVHMKGYIYRKIMQKLPVIKSSSISEGRIEDLRGNVIRMKTVNQVKYGGVRGYRFHLLLVETGVVTTHSPEEIMREIGPALVPDGECVFYEP